MIVSVTAFGQTREVEFNAPVPNDEGHVYRLFSVGGELIGRFPTGSKVHRTSVMLWNRNQGTKLDGSPKTLRGETAAVIDGDEFVLDTTLYTHNRNRGRIIGWYEDGTEATRQGW